MDNQHKKIKGYRDLSQQEIDLMNEIKAKGEELRALIAKVDGVITPPLAERHALGEFNTRATEADDPCYWLRCADSAFRTGVMQLVRAVAQPESY